MEKLDVTQQVKSLIDKAEKADMPDAALKYSQAATNAANALATMEMVRVQRGEEGK